MRPSRPRPLFVSWIKHHGRSEDLARVLEADCVFVAVGRLGHRPTAPLRYAVQALRTLALLAWRRPRVLLVMAPPAPLVLLGLAWARITGGALVVDCHSKAVIGQPLSARLARRAALVVVTLPELTEGFPRAVALHDPPATSVEASRHDEVVFPASWYDDEPIAELLDAAIQLPDTRFAVTGRAPAGLEVPPNVRLTGFLPRRGFLELVAGAPVVLALTDREATMQRAAYEAIAAGRPVVASDTTALRGYLGDAACYAGDLAGAITEALARVPELEAAARRVRAEQAAVFEHNLQTVRAVLSSADVAGG